MPAELRRRGLDRAVHHLLMLRSKLTFDQLVGDGIQYGDDQSVIRTRGPCFASAFCSDHVMRSGRHFAAFSGLPSSFEDIIDFGIVRPIQINRSDFADGELSMFSPAMVKFREYLWGKRSGRWGVSTIHCCAMDSDGSLNCLDWTSNKQSSWIDSFQRGVTTGLLLDLDAGMLSLYQNGQRLATLKHGISGEYCWFASAFNSNSSVSIQRDHPAPES